MSVNFLMLKKIQQKLSEFQNADGKVAWLVEQWKWRYFTYRHRKQARLNLAFDREHQIETADELALEKAGVPPADVARGNGVYRPLTQKLFKSAMASVRIDAETSTFVDIGSGKGKVLFMAAELPFKRIVGIEYAQGLHEIAVRNVASYRSSAKRCDLIEPIHADALNYQLPQGPLVLFIFNALAKEIMLEFLKKLDDGVASEPNRPVLLIYTNVRSVKEVGDVFSQFRNLTAVRSAKNFVVLANRAAQQTGRLEAA